VIRVSSDRLRHEAAIRGWDQRRLAREAGVSEGTISRALAGNPIRGVTALSVVQALRRVRPVPELERLIGDRSDEGRYGNGRPSQQGHR
jgi:transcriptional regulator with XRE-family HTH domain